MSQPLPDPPAVVARTKPDAASRRLRLREFQAQLVERMRSARSGTDTRVNRLGVLIGQQRCLLSLQDAGEIVAVGAITPVPLTHRWFLGLANIRGNLISVIDFAHYLGGAPTVIDKESRLVAFAPALSFNSALLVSRVLGLRNLTEMTLQEADAEGAPKCYVDQDAQRWTELDFSSVIQDPQFLQVGV